MEMIAISTVVCIEFLWHARKLKNSMKKEKS